MSKRSLYIDGIILVAGSMAANVLNMVLNLYLGRTLSLAEFGELTFYTSLLYFVSIPGSSYSETNGHTIAKIVGKYSTAHAKYFYEVLSRKTIWIGIVFMLLWLGLQGYLHDFFNVHTPYLVLLFAPLFVISVVNANISGFLKGTLSFRSISVIYFSEALMRFIVASLFIRSQLNSYAFVSVLVAQTFVMFLGLLFVRSCRSDQSAQVETRFNRQFFMSSLASGASVITFLSLDVLLAKHYLSPADAGRYGMLSLIGKMTWFFGSLIGPFMVPLVSRNEGANKRSRNTFLFLFGITLLFSLGSFLILGVLGEFTVGLVFGDRAKDIIPYLIPYVFAIAVFTCAQPIVSFFQAKEKFVFAFAGLFVAALQIVLFTLFHKDLSQIVWVMVTVSFSYLAVMLFLTFIEKRSLIQAHIARLPVFSSL